MSTRKVFLDVGGHLGETLAVAMDPRWNFERIWTFEPTSACWPALEAMADDRVEIVRAGLWRSDAALAVHDPGTLHASVEPAASREGRTEVCNFLDAARWMIENISSDDVVWMKVNVEAAEVEVLGRLLDSGEVSKIDHLVVHFDVEKVGRGLEAAPIRARLDRTGVRWREASEVMFGRTDSAQVETWLDWSHGHQWRFQRAKHEHLVRRQAFRLRRRLGRT